MYKQLLKERELSELPDELLVNIMIFLNDTTLLNMTLVSKRFRAIAKESIKNKYNGHNRNAYFEMDLFPGNIVSQRKQYQLFLCTFGETMLALSIGFSSCDDPVTNNHWFYALVQRYCTKLEKIKIYEALHIELSEILHPRLTSSLKHLELEHTGMGLINNWATCRFPNLISLHIDETSFCTNQHLIDFINRNYQLQHITLIDLIADNELEPHLHVLKEIASSCKGILTLRLINYREQSIKWDSELGDEMVSSLCKLVTLKSLKIDSDHLKISQLESILGCLPNLSLLSLTRVPTDSTTVDDPGHFFSLCRDVSHLRHLTIIDHIFPITFDVLTHAADVMQSEQTIRINRSSDSDHYEIVITKGMVRRHGIVVYEKDAVTMANEQRKSFLDLNNACLDKIIDFSTLRSHSALYDTCKRTRGAIETYYAENVINIALNVEQLDGDALFNLRKRIQYMALDNVFIYANLDRHEKLWTYINQYCTNLKELSIINCVHLCVPTSVWPVLKKLKFSVNSLDNRSNSLSEHLISYETLRSFVCPMLTHLEILGFRIFYGEHTMPQSFDHGDNFRCLTVLKFGYYSDDVKMFLEALDGNICEQMTELSIGAHLPMESKSLGDNDQDFFHGQQTESNIVLINIVSRFRKLTTLYLVARGVDCCDTKYLFENCTKLVTFGVWCWGDFRTDDMFRHVYDNCHQIKTIRLFGIGIFAKLLKSLRLMFSDASVEVAIQNNVSFSVSDENPSYNEWL